MKEQRRYIALGLTLFFAAVAILVFYDTFYQSGALQRFFVKLASVLAPVLYGLAMAYLLSPVVNWLEKNILLCAEKIRKKPLACTAKRNFWLRAVSILLTWALVLLLIYLLMSVLVPQLADSVKQLIDNAKAYYYQIYRWADTILTNNPEIGSWANDALRDYYSAAVSFLTNKLLPQAQEMATSLTGGVVAGIWSIISFGMNMVVGLIVSIYLMARKEQSVARCYKLTYAVLKENAARLTVRGARKTNEIFSAFVRGKLLDSLIIGIICFVGCSLLNMPYAPLVSVVVGVTNVIPFFGPFIGAIPSALLILLVSPRKSLIFVIFVVVLQQFDGNILGPKILGERTGISSLWVVIAILVGGGFGGVLGMFVGVPICACLQALMKYLMDNNLRSRNMPTEAYRYLRREEEPQPEEKKKQET